MLALALCFIVALIALPYLSRRAANGGAMPFRHEIERLEARIAPAALTARLGGGTLNISGDAISDEVNVIQGGGVIEVFDGALSLGRFQGVKHIKAELDGITTMTTDLASGGITGSLKVKAEGPTSLEVGDGSSIGRALKFKGDSTDQILTLGANVTLGKKLAFDGHKGVDEFAIGASSVIGAKTHFRDVENGIFDTTSVITIRGHLDFKNHATPQAVNITTTGPAGLDVSGKLRYAGGKGNDAVLLAGSFDGKATFKDKSGSNDFGLGANSVVHGKLRLTTGSGNDTFTFDSGTVDKGVKLKLGNGDNAFHYGMAAPVTILRSLSIKTGSGSDVWQTDGSSMKIGHNLDVKLGNAVNVVAAIAQVDGGKVSIIAGRSADAIAIDGSAANADIKVKLGQRDDSLGGSFFGVAESARFEGGKGTDRFFTGAVNADPVIIKSFEDFTPLVVVVKAGE